MMNKGLFPLRLRCAALRVAIDIETPIVFLYLSQVATRSAALSFTIAHYRGAAQRSRSGNTL